MKKFLLLVGLLTIGQFKVAAQSSPTTRYNTVADMVNAPILPVGNTNAQARITALVSGRVTANDGGGGTFFFVPGSAATTNLGTIFPCNGTGRWFREYDSAFNLKWFGGLGDDSTDNYSIITNLVGSVLSSGGALYIPKGTYRFSSTIVFGERITVFGDGARATILKYTGDSSYALTFGATDAAALVYGCKIADLQLTLTTSTANALQFACTSGMDVSNLYVEGVPSNTSEGIFVNAGNIGNQFTQITSVNLNHFKVGLRAGSSGTNVTTSIVTENLNVFGDVVAGSIGIDIDIGSGNGNRFNSGNIESYENGINVDHAGITFYGIRFEGNTTDITLGAAAKNITFVGCQNVSNIADNAGDASNAFVANQELAATSIQTYNRLQNLLHFGNLSLSKNAGGIRYIILNDTTTGSFNLQAGPGSGALGGGLALFGSSHASRPGWVSAGLGSGVARKFTVNDSGLGIGTDLFLVNETGIVEIKNYIEGTEIADPGVSAADKGRLYFRDNGAGKTQLVVVFSSGAVQVLATEP